MQNNRHTIPTIIKSVKSDFKRAPVQPSVRRATRNIAIENYFYDITINLALDIIKIIRHRGLKVYKEHFPNMFNKKILKNKKVPGFRAVRISA
jgi:hypothetical protein